jgi:DNA-binding MarR family transcriptional regulator
MLDGAPRRLTLLYQLYLTSQSSRRFMRLALAGTTFSGEEYALYSYLYANGLRTLSQAARDLGMPVTSLATVMAPLIEAGHIERTPHPRDRRARLLALTDTGRETLQAAIPVFTAAYRQLLARLSDGDVDLEAVYDALAALRGGIEAASEELEMEEARAGAR